ncbi:proteasome activator complex subunit 2 [Neosynchiropus ocellatus]
MLTQGAQKNRPTFEPQKPGVRQVELGRQSGLQLSEPGPARVDRSDGLGAALLSVGLSAPRRPLEVQQKPPSVDLVVTPEAVPGGVRCEGSAFYPFNCPVGRTCRASCRCLRAAAGVLAARRGRMCRHFLVVSVEVLKVRPQQARAMSKASILKISSPNKVQVSPSVVPKAAQKVETFCQTLLQEADDLFSRVIPSKILKLDQLLQDEAFTVSSEALRAPLDIPIPDPPPQEEEEMETEEDGEKKKKKAPKCGFIPGNQTIQALLDKVKPEVVDLRETIGTVTCWIFHLIPKIEDGNDFGVAVQEKILERMTSVKTKADTFQTNLNKYFSERGDAVAKASKETHVMDYRALVHEKDEAIRSDLFIILMDIRGYYTELYDIVSKNFEKVTNPKGEEKSSMY